MTTGIQYNCKICGKPVDPNKDILFGALGKPLFAAHAEGCASFVRETTQEAGKLAVNLFKARQPALYNNLLGGIAMAKRFLDAANGPKEETP